MNAFLQGHLPFLPEALEVFSIIAAQVSMAIDRKRLEEELRRIRRYIE